MAKILKAKPLVDKEIESLKLRCSALKEKGITPCMRVILVGDNPASVIYTRNKKKFCEKLGAECEIINLDCELSESDFVKEVQKIATDTKVHGCFVQLPLPAQLQHLNVGSLIPPHKDVDGFHAKNVNSLFQGNTGAEALLPCTPKGIVSLLRHYQIPIEGKNITVIGRSLIVGKPATLLLSNLNATVTLCHSKTKHLSEITKHADIIISAVGKPRFLNKDYLMRGGEQIIIDVGINHDDQGNLCGDVDFDSAATLAAGISPVPGGVGPMTILSLAQNLLQAAENSLYH